MLFIIIITLVYSQIQYNFSTVNSNGQNNELVWVGQTHQVLQCTIGLVLYYFCSMQTVLIV